jgi:hypothetical protein
MTTEDIVTIICLNKADAQAEKTRWQTALAGVIPVNVVVREVVGLPVMQPVTFGVKPVIFSLKISAAVNSAWVVTIERQ